MASGPASHVKPVTKQTFGRASPEAAREAADEALPNGALNTTQHTAARSANSIRCLKKREQSMYKRRCQILNNDKCTVCFHSSAAVEVLPTA